MDNRMTIKDIARMAGVSYTTVSRALNGEPYVKAEVSARIREICRQTGYTPNTIARQLKCRRSNTIGIIVPDISNAFFCEITRNIEWSARQQGYNVFISSSFYDYQMEERNIRALLGSRADGIVISGVGDRSPQTILSYADKVPMVFLGDNIPERGVSQISVDSAAGTRCAAEYLLSLGHRRFAFLGGRSSSITHRRRLEGFLGAVSAFPGAGCEVYSITEGSKLESGYETAQKFFSEHKEKEMPTAVMTINDDFAMGVMQAALEVGLRIPEDISLVGFDDISFAALPRIRLTTIAQPKEKLCQYALSTLLRLIEEKNSCILKEVVEPELMIRDTCAPVSP